jgi:hypothetical protein
MLSESLSGGVHQWRECRRTQRKRSETCIILDMCRHIVENETELKIHSILLRLLEWRLFVYHFIMQIPGQCHIVGLTLVTGVQVRAGSPRSSCFVPIPLGNEHQRVLQQID